MNIPILGDIIKSITDVVGKSIADRDKALSLSADLTKAVLAHSEEVIKVQRDIIVAEAQGESWLQRNWRPILMLTVVAIVANNYLLVPYFTAMGGNIPVLELPSRLWDLMTLGVGGYVAGRSIEKVVDNWPGRDKK